MLLPRQHPKPSKPLCAPTPALTGGASRHLDNAFRFPAHLPGVEGPDTHRHLHGCSRHRAGWRWVLLAGSSGCPARREEEGVRKARVPVPISQPCQKNEQKALCNETSWEGWHASAQERTFCFTPHPTALCLSRLPLLSRVRTPGFVPRDIPALTQGSTQSLHQPAAPLAGRLRRGTGPRRRRQYQPGSISTPRCQQH